MKIAILRLKLPSIRHRKVLGDISIEIDINISGD